MIRRHGNSSSAIFVFRSRTRTTRPGRPRIPRWIQRMSDQLPGDRPGHLDIDAVSAFIDRDLTADELALLAGHLTDCAACHREVLEIQATVMLLAGLPQYTPRHSFVLGTEHARAV